VQRVASFWGRLVLSFHSVDHGLVTAQQWQLRRSAFHPEKREVLIPNRDVYTLYDQESDTKQIRLGVCVRKWIKR
jgi:hypothetical protein